ncbi:MAG: hypothetical protein HY017_28760 [Betaproteobacteria bacterium]|nr:hypothetical protein [Betaproteobacteria bacterium]
MSPTLFEISVALVMAAVIVALLVWFARYLGASSERRMMRMLMGAGVDPDIAARGDKEAIFEDIRSRCQKCHAEDVCEQWLAGKIEGGNTFCPNAQIFSALTSDKGRIEASPSQSR